MVILKWAKLNRTAPDEKRLFLWYKHFPEEAMRMVNRLQARTGGDEAR